MTQSSVLLAKEEGRASAQVQIGHLVHYIILNCRIGHEFLQAHPMSCVCKTCTCGVHQCPAYPKFPDVEPIRTVVPFGALKVPMHTLTPILHCPILVIYIIIGVLRSTSLGFRVEGLGSCQNDLKILIPKKAMHEF